MSEENNQLIFYSTPQGNVKVEVIFESETFWLSQKRMAELFGVDVRTVNEHLKNIFKTGELKEDSVIRNFRITAADGKSYDTKFYMLDAILAVGYRVNSSEATQFRIWATKTLKEFIIKGFVLDDERLEAKLKAEGEFEKYRVIQDREYESDFDKAIKKISETKSENKKLKNK